jgi:hypothetical protein
MLLLGISTGLILGRGGGSGSGGSGTPSGGSAGTPSGKYTLAVQAASGSVTATQAITAHCAAERADGVHSLDIP